MKVNWRGWVVRGPVSGNRPNGDEIKNYHHHDCSGATPSANSLIDILWSIKHPHRIWSELRWKKRREKEGKVQKGELSCSYFYDMEF